MARPIKNYCDYFPHDRDMRNHRKVKAIRTKYTVVGYAIWSMILEYLTGIDGNEFEYSDVEFELMAGDFGVSATEIRDVVDYCIKLEMLFQNNGFISSESLDERLKPVYEKRGKSKSNSRKQQRVNGKFISSNTVSNGVSVAEMPQSKVNKSKVKEIKENIVFDDFWDLYEKKVGDRVRISKKWIALNDEDRIRIMEHIPKYKISQPDKKFRKDPETYLNRKSWNDEIIGLQENEQRVSNNSHLYKDEDFLHYQKMSQILNK